MSFHLIQFASAGAKYLFSRHLRVPALIRWPGVIKPGTVFSDFFAHEDSLPTFCAAGGDPDIVAKCANGYNAGNKTFKVHLDGYNLIPFFKGEEKESPRNDFLYWSDDGDLLAVRVHQWKIAFKEQEHTGLDVWKREFTNLRAPNMYNLRADPFELHRPSSRTGSIVSRSIPSGRTGVGAVDHVAESAFPGQPLPHIAPGMTLEQPRRWQRTAAEKGNCRPADFEAALNHGKGLHTCKRRNPLFGPTARYPNFRQVTYWMVSAWPCVR